MKSRIITARKNLKNSSEIDLTQFYFG